MGKIKITNLFKTKYIIPYFQREYAWDDKEIEEFISDICESKKDYCIGIITVTGKRKKVLIDGQQRITTLYMIAIACGYITNPNNINLEYKIDTILNKESRIKLLLKDENNFLYDKYKSIYNLIKKKGDIIEKLKNVYYYEINIENDIKDLNHYFEVMNSRGVQLCRSDIIKSYLMSFLNKNDQKRLNNLWNAYENMEIKTYSHFDKISKKTEYKKDTINNILERKTYQKEKTNEEKNEDNSILDFDYFLLYVIRLYRKIILGIIDDNKLFELTDLISDYKKTFPQKTSEKEIKKFLDFLIKIKNIYDRKIIKNSRRGNDDSNWIIKVDCKDKDEIIKIQSCLRVSFTSRKQMEWLFKTLEFFYNKNNINRYVIHMKKFIIEKYIKNFVEKIEKQKYKPGVETPRIVLNYLDYLIYYNEDKSYNYMKIIDKKNISKFTFKFRNSIEHLKSVKNEDIDKNKKWIDDFGNLALLSRGTNTKMQNSDPIDKANYYNKDLSKYSLKLQIMTLLTLKEKRWEEAESNYLKKDFIKLLKNDIEKLIKY